MILLNVIWPALYISQQFLDFWFLIFGTIIIELFTIHSFLKFSWKKSFLMSLIGNLVSGFIGTFVMVFAMLFWHLIMDILLPITISDIASVVLMFCGSVLIETLAIKLIYKEKIKRLFLPMMIGNLFSYIFILVAMLVH